MSRGRIVTVLAFIILLSEIATFEILMVLPALPHMAPAFQTLNIAWVVSIVTLAGGTMMPLVGKASDKWGKKRVILSLAAFFIAGSVLCAVATSFAMLMAGRILQGSLMGIVTISYGLIRDVIPRDVVPVALGAAVTGIGMSAIASPFIAGWLIDHTGYQGIFWFMAAYVAVLLPFYALIVPESPVRVDRPVDYLGIVLLGPGIAVLLVGITRGARVGWTDALTLAAVIGGAAMLVAFVVWQRFAPSPLIDLDILLGRRFGPTVLAVACISYMMSAHSLLIPTMLQTPAGLPGISYGAGVSALQFAIWTCPLGIASMFAGPLGGIISKRIGARYVLLTAAALFLVVMFLGSRLFTIQWQVTIMSCIMGFAVGFLHSSNANLVQDALPASQGGIGNAISGMGSLLAGGIATTLTGVVMSRHVLAVNPQTHAVLYADTAITRGYLYAALVGVVGLVVALLMRHGRSPAQGGLQEDVRPDATDTVDRVGAVATTP
ncbi:MFS transporter [Prescottella agglutinans]|uniref:MFS transporter n=2 Tax=Prescottella agglutinans TaxID=1644129 RepID=A0A438BIY2_9NOCA|nr:MFS transporter [Prescottella agglutinans]